MQHELTGGVPDADDGAARRRRGQLRAVGRQAQADQLGLVAPHYGWRTGLGPFHCAGYVLKEF